MKRSMNGSTNGPIRYVRRSDNDRPTEGWAGGVFEQRHVFRKVELDWKMAYLARTGNLSLILKGRLEGRISFRIGFSCQVLFLRASVRVNPIRLGRFSSHVAVASRWRPDPILFLRANSRGNFELFFNFSFTRVCDAKYFHLVWKVADQVLL